MEEFKIKSLFESLKTAEYKYLTAKDIIKQIKESTTKEERIRLANAIKKQPYILKEADNSEYLKVVDYIVTELLND